jgi:Fe-S cluster assembly protein SufD
LARRSAIVKEAVIPLTQDDVVTLSDRLGDPAWLREQRLAAWAQADAMPMPTTSDEPWRRTDIRMLDWEEAVHLDDPGSVSLDDVPTELYSPLIGDEQGGLLVFVNGRLVRSEIADQLAKQGVIFADLSSAAHDHPDLLRRFLMAHAVQVEEGKFAALQGALWTHGVFLYVPRNVQIELPLHSIEYAPNNQTTAMHILVVLEEGASATYLHESASPNLDGQIVRFGATELLVGDNANLRYVALQNWGENVYYFGHQGGRVAHSGQLDWVVGEMGGRLGKVFQTLDLDGNGSWGRMSGLYFTDNRQHLDLDTQQNHHALNTTSDLLFKGALKGHSRSVWQGMIAVDPGAQKTDGFQANRNLILENTARADSIPGLEIQADDVRCTHASTVGRVDDTEIFYLMSRGIPRDEATRLIVHGFFDPVMQRIPFQEVQDRLWDSIEDKLNGASRLRGA